ncbi:hypothetical protein [Bordetella hinzii]|uniref:N-acetyltransferase YedL n=1 Tax=Bordetella hinzii OH87 BAL007II TaxID=1331262 RepID=A0ABR4R6D3_9BORD|nr:hypothetical protein [Bordetella hinzii]KCB25094.1 hypothetical protein L544_1112 [Bordetella hinzii OH87 BAL007II]QDJ43780.1 hypothetical protein CBR70_22125 [Bordetella hinzii]
MNVFPIPDSLAEAYHGAGWALGAVLGGQLVALRYVADLGVSVEPGAAGVQAVRAWIESPGAAPVVRELQALGRVTIGMCSGWQFVEQ